jgi:hypothetical protein
MPPAGWLLLSPSDLVVGVPCVWSGTFLLGQWFTLPAIPRLEVVPSVSRRPHHPLDGRIAPFETSDR